MFMRCAGILSRIPYLLSSIIVAVRIVNKIVVKNKAIFASSCMAQKTQSLVCWNLILFLKGICNNKAGKFAFCRKIDWDVAVAVSGCLCSLNPSLSVQKVSASFDSQLDWALFLSFPFFTEVKVESGSAIGLFEGVVLLIDRHDLCRLITLTWILFHQLFRLTVVYLIYNM